MSRLSTTCLMTIALLASPAVSFAQEAPSATIAFSGGSVAAGVGYTWGNGTLLFKGKPYPFTVSGLSVVDIGIDRIDGAGTVYNLKNPADAAGTYFAAGDDRRRWLGGGARKPKRGHRPFSFKNVGPEAQPCRKRHCCNAEINNLLDCIFSRHARKEAG